MKYKVKNVTTGEEIICEKVVVDNYDYYVNGDEILFDDCYIYCNQLSKRFRKNPLAEYLYPQYKKVIATTNKSLGLPMVIDEVEELAEISSEMQEATFNSQHKLTYKFGYIDGYQRAKETYFYTKEDMVGFATWFELYFIQHSIGCYEDSRNGKLHKSQNILDLWQEQRTKTILVK